MITLILALVAGVVDFLKTPPLFVSRASMWETEKLQLPDGASFAQDQDTYFGTLTAVLQSEPLREMALSRLQTNQIVVDQYGNPLSVSINVYQAPKSSVFIVEANSANPYFTQVYLDALVGSYLDYKKTVRKDVSDDTLASIDTQINILQSDMNDGKKALSQFEESNNLTILEQENEVGAAELAKLQALLADYLLQSNMLDAVALEKSTAPIGPLFTSTNMPNPLFGQIEGGNAGGPVSQSEDAIQQIEQLKFQRARLSKYLRPTHPKIVKLDEDITNAQNLVDYYRRENDEGITDARKALKIRMDSVTNAIYQWEAKVKYDSARIAESDNLKDSITGNQKMFDRLSALLDNVDITKNIDQDPLAVLEHASGATRSYAKFKSNLVSAGIGGLAIGLGIILLITIRDDRFSSVTEVAERIGDHVVGQVPEMAGGRNGVPLALLVNNDERHMYVESYRNLRSALLYFAIDGARPKTLLITSAVPNEGKSTIASNLSVIMALGGARVLLVDADLRKGRLHDLLEMKSKPGLTELLLDPGNMDKYIQETPMANLWFIARGGGQRNPGDLFLSNTFDRVLAALRERFDYIIVDSPPVFAADDSTTLAPKMDGTLFVVRSHFSRSNVVKEALELLYQRQATVLGLILNRTDATGRSYHYYKYSEYHSTTETT